MNKIMYLFLKIKVIVFFICKGAVIFVLRQFNLLF